MTMPSFTVEASIYATRQHYGYAVASKPWMFGSVLAQQLCRQLGELCGGIDLVCCRGLTCTAGLGGDGICVPQDVPCCWPPGCQICDNSA
jgi:hypothetical protein